MLYVKPETDTVAILTPLSQGTDEQVLQVFNELVMEYRQGFQARRLYDRFKSNVDYLSGNHWDQVNPEDPNEPQPHTPVLWSTRENIHADLVEAYPRANPEPERTTDANKVRIAADLLNSVRYRRNYRAKWAQWTKGMLDQGVDFMEVFWDKTLYGGLGDVNYLRWSVRSLLFDPYVSDVNDSEGFIVLTFERIRSLQGKYPDKRDKISAKNAWGITLSDFTGGTVPVNPQKEGEMALVARFFWREFQMEKTSAGSFPVYTLHWAKIAGGAVVERQQPDADGSVPSLYRHGEYPFVPVSAEDDDGNLFPLGLIDRFKKMQWFVDAMDQQVLKNLFVSARQKMLVSDDAHVDIDALRDWKKDVVKGQNIGETDIRWFENKQFASAPMEYARLKAEDLKDESGANQFYRGEGGRGVTAASAIFALQDASGRRNKKLITRCYDADCKVSMLTLELMCEFYTEGRTVMLVDDNGKKRDLTVSNADLMRDGKNGVLDMRMRMSAEKNQGYQTESKNQTAIQLMQSGVVDQAIGLMMMDFDDKDKVMAAIRERDASELTQLRQLVTRWQPIIEQVMKAQQGQPGPFMPPTVQPEEEMPTGDEPAA